MYKRTVSNEELKKTKSYSDIASLKTAETIFLLFWLSIYFDITLFHIFVLYLFRF